MGCHASKSTQVVGESEKPGEQSEEEEPNLEAVTKVADGQDTTSLKDGAPESVSPRGQTPSPHF